MAKRDYYQILSVSKSASQDEIKKAYRQSALMHHPDRNPNDKKAEERFKEATEAYQVLSDSEKRRVYDEYGHDGLQSMGGFSQGSGFGDIFEDIFEDFFGGGHSSRSARAQRGRDLQYELEILFTDAAFGLEKTIEIQRDEACSACKGDGAKPGTSRKTCQSCHGSGQILASSGFFSISRTCSRCHGEGSFVEHKCQPCEGSGRISVSRKIQVKVPMGVDNGMRLRISGEGEAGMRGGPRGDLFIDIHVKTHEFFSRQSINIICEVPISFVQAALGDEVCVPTLTGTTMLKIPAGIQSGKVLKLKGKGITSLNGSQIGDQEIKIIVETPTHLTDKQKELLKQFSECGIEKANPLSSSFVERVKKLFSKDQKH
jgi:molecular chaperone DnaJ